MDILEFIKTDEDMLCAYFDLDNWSDLHTFSGFSELSLNWQQMLVSGKFRSVQEIYEHVEMLKSTENANNTVRAITL